VTTPPPSSATDNAAAQANRAVAIFLTTGDVHANYHELRSRGVEFVEKPKERRPMASDRRSAPLGNHIRLTQVREMASV
jgi:hypothetical protein